MKTSLYNQIILKISEIEKILNEGKGYNPYRDAKGRFANGPSSAFGDYYVGGSMGSYDRLDRAGLKGIASRTGIATSPLDSKNTEAFARTSLCAKVSEEKIESLKDRLLRTYPFATVDSTSWTSMARFATSRVHDNDTAKILAKTRHYSKNLVGEVMFWTDVQKDVTTLWKKRGITWGELDKPKFLEYAKNRPTYHEWKNKKH